MANIDPPIYKGPYLENEDGSLSYLGPDLLPRPFGGGNATVPDNAPIQSPQAFVDVAPLFLSSLTNGNTTLDLSSHALTFCRGGDGTEFGLALWATICGNYSGSPTINLSNNDLASVDEILASLVAVSAAGIVGTLDLSAGTNAAPSKPDAATYASDSSYVRTGDLNGHPLYYNGGNHIGYNGTQWVWYDTNPAVADDSATSGDAPFPWLATGWNNPVTQAPNADLQTLLNNSWTINTN